MFGAGKSTGTLGTQTDYLTQNMAEAAAAASSLGQTHSNLTQIYTSEAAALRNLAGALEAAAVSQRKMMSASPAAGRTKAPRRYASGTMSVPGYAKGTMSVPKYAKGTMSVPGYAEGIFSVPGPKGKGDIVPAMLSPGEAVIPTDMAKKYAPLIQGIIAGNIPGYAKGGLVQAHLQGALDKSDPVVLEQILKAYPGYSQLSGQQQGMFQASGSLTADVGAKLNEALKRVGPDGVQGLVADQFSAAWNAVSNKLGTSAKQAGVSEYTDVIAKIEKEIGEEAVKLAGAGGKVSDQILATATSNVLSKQAKKGGSNKVVADALSARASTLGDIRSAPGKVSASQLRASLASGETVKGSDGQYYYTDSSGKAIPGSPPVGRESQSRGPKQSSKYIPRGYRSRTTAATIVDPQNAMLGATGQTQAKAVAAGRAVVKKQSEAFVDGLAKEAKTASPSRRTRKVAKDTVDGYIGGLEEGKAKAAKAGSQTQALVAKEAQGRGGGVGARVGSAARNAGSRIKGFVGSGRGAMVGSVASMGLMMGSSMMPPEAGAAGSIVGGVGMGASMGSMLGPKGAAVGAAIGLVASSAIALKEAFDGAQRSAEAFAKTTGASSQAIKALSEASGTVSAGEAMDKRRETSMQFERTEETNAVSQEYLASETGQASIQALGKSLSSGGSQAAISNIVSQMTTAIASGAVSATDARAIVEDIGTQLGDSSFALKANAEIKNIIGPNGENLAKDPIGVRLKILEDTQGQLGAITDKVGGLGEDMAQIATTNLFNFDTPLATLNSILNLTSPIALITNTIIGGVQQMQELGTSTAAFAANVTIAAQQGHEMIDSLQFEYEQRIAIATAAGDLAEATRLQTEYEQGRRKVLTQNAETLKSASKAYSEMESNAQTGVIGSIDQQIKDLYKEGPLAALAEQSISQIGSLTADGSQTEFLLKTTLSSGDVDPETMNSVLALLGEEQIDVAANIITNFGGAEADRIFELSKLVDNPEIRTSLLVGMQGMTPEEAARTLTTFEEIGKVAGQEGIEAIVNLSINDNGELDIAKLDEITNKIKGLEAEFNAGPVSAERLRQYIFESTGFNITQDQMDYYNSLPPDQQKTYTTTFLTILRTINEDLNTGEGMIDLRQWAEDSGRMEEFMVGYSAGGNSSRIFNYNAAAAARADALARQQAAPPPGTTTTDDPGDDSGGGGGGGGSSAPQKTAQEIELENLNDQLSKQQKALNVLKFQEDEINEKYNKRKETLKEIAEINAQISEEQRGQLDLAGALASGDIAAAARSAQEIRAKAADNAVKDQEKALEEAQKRELAAVTFDGQTREQREQQIKDLEKKIAELEYRMPKKEDSGSGGSGGGGIGGSRGGSRTITTGPAAPPVTSPVLTPAVPPVASADLLAISSATSQFYGMTKALDLLTQPAYSAIDALKLSGKEMVNAASNTTALRGAIVKMGGTITSDGIVQINGMTTDLATMSQELVKISPNIVAASEAAYDGAIESGKTAQQASVAAAEAANAAAASATAAGKAGNAARGAVESIMVASGSLSLATWAGRWGYLAAAGGLITGPGTATSDSIPAMLSNGEYVVRASSVSKVGLPFMEAINNGEMPDLRGTKIAVPGIKYNANRPSINKGDTAQESSSSVYNYSVVVNAETNANPDQIASAVMSKIKQVEGQRVRGVIR
jgi:hypothetical protein